MSETPPHHDPLQPADHPKNFHPPKPYWRRMHTHWAFWVAVIFLFVALFIYIFSYDLALVPRK